jgi:hypothetical protein
MDWSISSTTRECVSKRSGMAIKVRELLHRRNKSGIKARDFQDTVVQTIAASRAPKDWVLATTAMEGDGIVRIWRKERNAPSYRKGLRSFLLLLIGLFIIHQLLTVSQACDCDGRNYLHLHQTIAAFSKPVILKVTGHAWTHARQYHKLPTVVRIASKRSLRFCATRISEGGAQVWAWLNSEERANKIRYRSSC